MKYEEFSEAVKKAGLPDPKTWNGPWRLQIRLNKDVPHAYGGFLVRAQATYQEYLGEKRIEFEIQNVPFIFTLKDITEIKAGGSNGR